MNKTFVSSYFIYFSLSGVLYCLFAYDLVLSLCFPIILFDRLSSYNLFHHLSAYNFISLFNSYDFFHRLFICDFVESLFIQPWFCFNNYLPFLFIYLTHPFIGNWRKLQRQRGSYLTKDLVLFPTLRFEPSLNLMYLGFQNYALEWIATKSNVCQP